MNDDDGFPLTWQPLWVGSLHHGVYATPAALAAIERGGTTTLAPLLEAHGLGKPGWLHPDDVATNDAGYRARRWYMSVWRTGDADDPEVWIVTEDGHEVTTVVLPHER